MGEGGKARRGHASPPGLNYFSLKRATTDTDFMPVFFARVLTVRYWVAENVLAVTVKARSFPVANVASVAERARDANTVLVALYDA